MARRRGCGFCRRRRVLFVNQPRCPVTVLCSDVFTARCRNLLHTGEVKQFREISRAGNAAVSFILVLTSVCGRMITTVVVHGVGFGARLRIIRAELTVGA
jgi:hypothetical protein